MEARPLVSVVVPVYNAKKHLPECLDSIAAQTLERIEIICVDDGSTDGSLDVLYEYAAADSRFVVITQKNQYAGANSTSLLLRLTAYRKPSSTTNDRRNILFHPGEYVGRPPPRAGAAPCAAAYQLCEPRRDEHHLHASQHDFLRRFQNNGDVLARARHEGAGAQRADRAHIGP